MSLTPEYMSYFAVSLVLAVCSMFSLLQPGYTTGPSTAGGLCDLFDVVLVCPLGCRLADGPDCWPPQSALMEDTFLFKLWLRMTLWLLDLETEVPVS